MRIRLDRTVCDGFGICAKKAPGHFSLDDWGYASIIGDGVVASEDGDAVMRALMDCPVHAIMEMDERRPDDLPPPPDIEEDPAARLKTESNEAEWGFTR
ncbi:ferredoxin [Mycobacterium spongiae]|uniref:Ferredoxin n=1 Tax=Mycobacterium spongiae TaxID=886343 RepID=A0A975K2U3_9MYCO|nr:ferredoxin [Mycobacterium spongiae]QUR68903.1 ferredoxin [Mycobacterium spongiae]